MRTRCKNEQNRFSGLPTLVGKALSFTHELFSIFLFLSIHRAQQLRSRWPSNVFRRFGRRWSFNNWSSDLAQPSPNFHRGSKSGKFGVVFNITQLWAARVWKCCKVFELWNKSATQQWSPYVLAKFGEVGSTHLWEPFVRSAHPLKLHGENVLNGQ